MRRFLVSYYYTVGPSWAFGCLFHERADDTLPGPRAIVGICEHAAKEIGVSRDNFIVVAISEVSPDGPVVT